ncbi:MAG TPA: ankyrin repeat domain-containing protein [Gammaproteobacteria bacterium]|jgi:ankyrin repeat protein|nr:ankyrin repeat domain-containing protein [Gammaproteobacteria bacterium]
MSNMSPNELFSAVRAGDAAYIKNYFAQTTLAETKAMLAMRTSANDTLLHLAAEYGHLAIVEELIARGADVNAVGDLGETPLHRAAYYAYVPVMQTLLDNGADYKITRYDGEMAIHVAAIVDSVDAVDALIKHDQSQMTVCGREARTAFFRAALSKSFKTMEYLLSHGDDVNQRNRMTNISAIQVAFVKGQTDLAGFLQKHGAVMPDDDTRKYTI